MEDLSRMTRQQLFDLSEDQLSKYLLKDALVKDVKNKINISKSLPNKKVAPEFVTKMANILSNKINKIKSSNKYVKTGKSPQLSNLEERLSNLSGEWQLKKQ